MKRLNEREKGRNGRIQVILPLIFVCFLIGCGSYRCTVQTHELIDAVYEILISEKICKNVNDCRNKNYALCRSSKDASISIYGVTDRDIIKKIIALCIDKKTTNRNIKYELYVYPKTKTEDYNQKPILTLILQEG